MSKWRDPNNGLVFEDNQMTIMAALALLLDGYGGTKEAQALARDLRKIVAQIRGMPHQEVCDQGFLP